MRVPGVFGAQNYGSGVHRGCCGIIDVALVSFVARYRSSHVSQWNHGFFESAQALTREFEIFCEACDPRTRSGSHAIRWNSRRRRTFITLPRFCCIPGVPYPDFWVYKDALTPICLRNLNVFGPQNCGAGALSLCFGILSVVLVSLMACSRLSHVFQCMLRFPISNYCSLHGNSQFPVQHVSQNL